MSFGLSFVFGLGPSEPEDCFLEYFHFHFHFHFWKKKIRENRILFALHSGAAQHNLGPKTKNLCGTFNR